MPAIASCRYSSTVLLVRSDPDLQESLAGMHFQVGNDPDMQENSGRDAFAREK